MTRCRVSPLVRATAALYALPAALVAFPVLSVTLLPVAPAGAADITTSVSTSYYYQRYNNWCASASVEMILSSPAIRNNDQFISNFLNAPDQPGVSAFEPRLQPTFVNTPLGVNTSLNPQAFLYNLVHGVGTVTNNGVSRTYFNPYLPYGTGGDTLGITTALSLLDTPGFQGAGVAQGKHTFTGWNFAPSIGGAALATKQIADSIKLTEVAAQATVGHGAHSIVVKGVTTDVAIAPNTNYNVTGVIVADPWTGFVDQQVGSGRPNPGGGRGFGYSAWVPNGYDIIPGAPVINVPGVGAVRGRYKKWLTSFNVAPANPGAFLANPAVGGIWSTPGVQFVTASSSQVNNNTVPLETGGPNGNFYGLIGTPALAQPINNVNLALARAIAAVQGNAELGAAFPLGGGAPADADGAFSAAAAVFLADPVPLAPGDGDWILPFLAHPTDTTYTGALAIDALTGDVDLGIYTPDAAFDYSISDLTTLFNDITTDNFPSSGFDIPEPAALGGLVPCIVLFRRTRRV